MTRVEETRRQTGSLARERYRGVVERRGERGKRSTV
jgi:hypothetical protein